MLVLSRKLGERIHVGDDIEVVVLRIKGGTIRLGIKAPRTAKVVRDDARNKKAA
jgi:carbon storage regulator